MWRHTPDVVFADRHDVLERTPIRREPKERRRLRSKTNTKGQVQSANALRACLNDQGIVALLTIAAATEAVCDRGLATLALAAETHQTPRHQHGACVEGFPAESLQHQRFDGAMEQIEDPRGFTVTVR